MLKSMPGVGPTAAGESALLALMPEPPHPGPGKKPQRAPRKRRRRSDDDDSDEESDAGPRGKKSKASIYRGVTWHPKTQMWYARISENGKETMRKYFQSAEEAARAYDEKARALWGAQALVNFDADGNFTNVKAKRRAGEADIWSGSRYTSAERKRISEHAKALQRARKPSAGASSAPTIPDRAAMSNHARLLQLRASYPPRGAAEALLALSRSSSTAPATLAPKIFNFNLHGSSSSVTSSSSSASSSAPESPVVVPVGGKKGAVAAPATPPLAAYASV